MISITLRLWIFEYHGLFKKILQYKAELNQLNEQNDILVQRCNKNI